MGIGWGERGGVGCGDRMRRERRGVYCEDEGLPITPPTEERMLFNYVSLAPRPDISCVV